MGKRKRQYRGRPSKTPQSRTKNPSSWVIPLVALAVVAVVVAGVVVSLNLRTSRATTDIGEAGLPVVTTLPLATSSPPYPDVPRSTLQETVEGLEKGQALLLDVRSKDSYDKGHAGGAISIPEAEVTSRIDELPRDVELILYCT